MDLTPIESAKTGFHVIFYDSEKSLLIANFKNRWSKTRRSIVWVITRYGTSQENRAIVLKCLGINIKWK